MKKTFLFILIFICSLFVSYGENRPKLAINVFANEYTCWQCMRSVNTISKTKLNYYQLEIILYFCSEDEAILEKLVKEYEVECKCILDPECLYAKKYNISRLPGIAIKDKEKDSVLIATNWDNPKEYIDLIKEYDKNYTAENKKGLEYLLTPLKIREKNGTPIKISNIQIAYQEKMKKYYAYLNNEYKKICVLDSTGRLEEEIDLTKFEEIESFGSNSSLHIMNDSILIWQNYIRKNYIQMVIYGLNIYTKRIVKKGLIDTSHYSENSAVEDLGIVPKANKIILSKYYFDNNTLDKNKNLLLLSDTNFNSDKYFGRIDPVCESTTMASYIMASGTVISSNRNRIYSLMSLSDKLFEYDLDGKYINTIKLEFESDYNPPLTNVPEQLKRNELFDIWEKYKLYSNIFVQNERIIVVAGKYINNPETLKSELNYYLTIFDNSGKRIANTIALPKNIKNCKQVINNKLLLSEEEGNGAINIRWLDVDKLVNQGALK